MRVVDLTSSLAGPTCTEILGGLGAEVVKVEHPARGDEARAWGPSFYDGGSVMFFAANRSKRSLALDFKDLEGMSALLRLIDSADVFVQSMRAGAVDRLGLGSDDLRARNEQLVYCSIRAFGRHGPLASEAGYDPLMQAFAGLISITGEPDRPGVRVGTSLIDTGTGVWAALGIVAALLERSTTGRGREVDVSLFDTALSLVGYQLTAALRTGETPGRHGTAFPLIAPYEVFETADGELMIAAANDRLFRLLCERIGAPELADDPRFRTNPDRLVHREELLGPIREPLRAQPSAHWLEVLPGHSRCSRAGPGAGRDSPADSRRAGWCNVRGPRVGRGAAPGRRPQARALRSPPLLGEHTDEIMAELGYSDDDVARLGSGAL